MWKNWKPNFEQLKQFSNTSVLKDKRNNFPVTVMDVRLQAAAWRVRCVTSAEGRADAWHVASWHTPDRPPAQCSRCISHLQSTLLLSPLLNSVINSSRTNRTMRYSYSDNSDLLVFSLNLIALRSIQFLGSTETAAGQRYSMVWYSKV